MDKQILVSRIQTPDGTILESLYEHDYVTYNDSISNEVYMLDGGPSDYGRRMSINNIPAKDISIYTDSDFNDIRNNLKRGTFNKNGNRIWIKLKDMTTQHLFNCIIYNQKEMKDSQKIDKFTIQYIRELAYRYDNNILY